MKNICHLSICVAATTLLLAGCASAPNSIGVTNQQQPGPAIGRAAGSGVGAVTGNVLGGGAGVVEGTAGGIHSAFDNTQRTIRYWREEKTADGRMILVPEEFLVDKDGRVIRQIRTGEPSPK